MLELIRSWLLYFKPRAPRQQPLPPLLRWTSRLLFHFLWLGIVLGLLAWQLAHYSHTAWYQSVECLISQLARQQPPHFSEQQWSQCLLHTWNLHTNFGDYSHWNVATRKQFLDTFRQKVRQGDGLATVEWFWDAYRDTVPRSRGYQRYRPTTSEWLKTAEEVNVPTLEEWEGISNRDIYRYLNPRPED